MRLDDTSELSSLYSKYVQRRVRVTERESVEEEGGGTKTCFSEANQRSDEDGPFRRAQSWRGRMDETKDSWLGSEQLSDFINKLVLSIVLSYYHLLYFDSETCHSIGDTLWSHQHHCLHHVHITG